MIVDVCCKSGVSKRFVRGPHKLLQKGQTLYITCYRYIIFFIINKMSVQLNEMPSRAGWNGLAGRMEWLSGQNLAGGPSLETLL